MFKKIILGILKRSLDTIMKQNLDKIVHSNQLLHKDQYTRKYKFLIIKFTNAFKRIE